MLKVMEPEMPAGWRLFDRSQFGFGIAAPLEWTVRPPMAIHIELSDSEESTPPPPQEIPKDLTEDEKQMLSKLEPYGIYLRLYDSMQRPIPGEIETSVTIKKESGGSTTIDDAAKDYANRIGARPEEHSRIQLPIGPAEEFKTHTTDIKGDVLYKIEYVIVNGGDVYTVTLVATNNDSAISDKALPMIQTFRVKP